MSGEIRGFIAGCAIALTIVAGVVLAGKLTPDVGEAGDAPVVIVEVIPAIVDTPVPLPTYTRPSEWSDVPVRSGRAVGRQLVMSVPDGWEVGSIGGAMAYEKDALSVLVFPSSTIPANETEEEHSHRLNNMLQKASYDYGLVSSAVDLVGNNTVYVLQYDVRTAAGEHLSEKIYMEVFLPDGRAVALWFASRRDYMTNKEAALFLEIAESVRWSEPLKQGV